MTLLHICHVDGLVLLDQCLMLGIIHTRGVMRSVLLAACDSY